MRSLTSFWRTTPGALCSSKCAYVHGVGSSARQQKFTGSNESVETVETAGTCFVPNQPWKSAMSDSDTNCATSVWCKKADMYICCVNNTTNQLPSCPADQPTSHLHNCAVGCAVDQLSQSASSALRACVFLRCRSN